MDTISFSIEQGDRWEIVNILVNSRNLTDIVREVELPYALAEGHPNIAGKYAGLPKKIALLPSKHLLGESYLGYGLKNRGAVLVCTCGEPICSPLDATITLTDGEVIWHNFDNSVRSRPSRSNPYNYNDLGPFHFDRQQYEDALRKMSQHP